MNRAGAGGSQANADFSGKFGMRAGHKSGYLFMAYLDKFKLIGTTI
jgi:hypothetical protein